MAAADIMHPPNILESDKVKIFTLNYIIAINNQDLSDSVTCRDGGCFLGKVP